jgi:hypothetical protein
MIFVFDILKVKSQWKLFRFVKNKYFFNFIFKEKFYNSFNNLHLF